MKISSARRAVLRGLVAVAVMGAGAVVFADDPIPKPFPMAHFEKLAARSPFSPPTAVVAPPPTAPTPPPSNFADKFTLAGIMQQGSDYVATLNNKETSEHIRVSSKGEPNQGLNVSTVSWGNDPTQTQVTLVKDKGSAAPEFGVVEFDPNQSPATATSMGTGMPGGIPSRPNLRPVPPIPGGVIRPPPGAVPNRIIPGAIPNNQPNRRPGIIRAPGVTTAAPRPNQPGVNFTSVPQLPKPAASDDDDDDDDE